MTFLHSNIICCKQVHVKDKYDTEHVNKFIRNINIV